MIEGGQDRNVKLGLIGFIIFDTNYHPSGLEAVVEYISLMVSLLII